VFTTAAAVVLYITTAWSGGYMIANFVSLDQVECEYVLAQAKSQNPEIQFTDCQALPLFGSGVIRESNETE